MKATSKIFINYRREDTSGYAGRIFDSLSKEFGEDNICVNLLWPGWQNTKLAGRANPGKAGWRDHALRRSPALEEVIRTVVHLVQVKDVSGQVWNCDSRLLFL